MLIRIGFNAGVVSKVDEKQFMLGRIKMFIKRNNVLVAFLLSSFIVLFALIACSSNSNNGASRDKKQDWLSKLSLAPDGKRAVFERSFRNEPVKIYEYFVESGELKSFNPPDNQSWLMPCYSNNGKSIVFVAAAKNGKDLDLTNMHIAIMDTNGENFMQLTNESGTRIHPSFSHSGDQLSFSRSGDPRFFYLFLIPRFSYFSQGYTSHSFLVQS